VPAFVVGAGIASAMTADRTNPASDETYVTGTRPVAQWSVAMARDGAEYRWVRSTGRVHRYRPQQEGQLQTRWGPAPPVLASAIRRFFPAGEWVNAAEIAYCESGWNPRALADTVASRGPCGTRYQLPNGQWATTERSRGYFQINGCSHPQWDSDDLYDPERNAEAAAHLHRQRGNWGAWFISAGKLGLPR